mmetsp:Transcript_25929/g.64937  ORF Transcript_25929/g.64937 Transcript_25929/m.64937 type:complete len:332 (-) Transcript_25929:19-1014(-)
MGVEGRVGLEFMKPKTVYRRSWGLRAFVNTTRKPTKPTKMREACKPPTATYYQTAWRFDQRDHVSPPWSLFFLSCTILSAATYRAILAAFVRAKLMRSSCTRSASTALCTPSPASIRFRSVSSEVFLICTSISTSTSTESTPMLAGWRVGGLAAAGEGGLEAWVDVLVVPASGTSARAGRRAGGGSPLAAASLSAVTCLMISDTSESICAHMGACFSSSLSCASANALLKSALNRELFSSAAAYSPDSPDPPAALSVAPPPPRRTASASSRAPTPVSVSISVPIPLSLSRFCSRSRSSVYHPPPRAAFFASAALCAFPLTLAIFSATPAST